MMQVWGAGTESQGLNPYAMLDRLTDGFLALDTEWQLVYLNDAAYDWLLRIPVERDAQPAPAALSSLEHARAKEALLGKPIWEALPDEARLQLSFALQEAVRTQCAARIAHCPDEGDGYELRLHPSDTGLSVTIVPASRHPDEDRGRLQRRLEALEGKLDALYRLTHDVIAHVSPDGIVLDISPAVFHLLGYLPEEVIGLPIEAYIDTDEQRFMQRTRPKPHARQDQGVARLRFRHRDGHPVVCEASYAHIRAADGTLLHTVSVCRDITASIAAQKELRRSKDIVQLAQRIAGIGHYEWNVAARTITWSDEMYGIMGWEPGDYSNASEALREILHPDDRAMMEANRARVEALAAEPAPASDRDMLTSEFRVFAKSGEIRIIQSVAKLCRDGKGHADRLFGTVRDISSQRQTEELLRKSEKLKTVGQLAAGIAHEIRNPLTSLKGFSKLLRNAADAPAERYYRIMEAEFDRIEMILGELLVLAKPHATTYEPWDVRLIVQEVSDLLGSQAILSDVVIHTELLAEECSVRCEKNQLKQVVMNIVKNAIEAMPDGGDLRALVSREAGAVLIRVSDQGVGIDEDKLPKLGEPFYTTKERGTGLGLMVSYKIIEEHEGSLEFASKPGEGTTVTIRLPVHR